MWTCPQCRKTFVRDNQSHSCNDKTLSDYLQGKSELTISLYDHFIRELSALGDIQIRPTKSAIALSVDVRLGHIHRLGKNFVDVVFYFDKPYEDNLCFYKIANVPGSTQNNHYFRMMNEEDINEEVVKYMKMAVKAATRK